MQAQSGPRAERNLAERAVFIQHINGAKLVEIESHVGLEHGLRALRGAGKCLQGG